MRTPALLMSPMSKLGCRKKTRPTNPTHKCPHPEPLLKHQFAFGGGGWRGLLAVKLHFKSKEKIKLGKSDFTSGRSH